MPRSPLTEPLLRVQGMIAYVRENLSTDEYMLFLDLLAPEPEPEAKVVKKPRKKSSKSSQSSAKSSRASGMAAQLNRSLARQRQTAKEDNDENEERCIAPRSDQGGRICALLPDHNVHHLESAQGFHPFQSSSSAPPAPAPSPANGEMTNGTVNSGTVTESAGVVVHGASEGASGD